MCRVKASPLILHKGSRQVEDPRPQIPDRSPKAERARGTGQVHPWGNGPAGGRGGEGAGKGGGAVWRVSPIKGQPAQFHGETQPSTTMTDPYFREARKMHFKPYLQALRLVLTQVPARWVRRLAQAGPVWPTTVSQLVLHRGDSTASPSFSFTPAPDTSRLPRMPHGRWWFRHIPHIRVPEDTGSRAGRSWTSLWSSSDTR